MNNKKIFKEHANHYDQASTLALANQINKRIDLALNQLDYQDKSLLEYGAGTGLIGLKQAFKFKDVTLVDYASEMIEIIESKIKDYSINNVKTQVVDLLHDDLNDSYDVIIVSLVMLHIQNYQSVIKKLVRALNANGKLIIVDFISNDKVNHPLIHSGFSHQQIKELLDDNHLIEEVYDIFYSGEKIFAKEDASLFISISTKELN